MQYNALRYFVEVVEQGSINKASEALYISQPNLSTAIRHLEEDFGFKLLDRSNRGIRLTENGKEIYFYAKQIFSQLDRLEQFAEIHTYDYPFKLSLSISGIFLSGDLFNGFYEERSQTRLEFSVYEVGLETVLNNVARLVSDLGVAVVNEMQLPDFKRVIAIKNLTYEVVDEGELMVLIGPQSPFHTKEKVSAMELLTVPLIRFPDDYFTELNQKCRIGNCVLSDFKWTITMNHCHSIINLLKNSDAFLFGNRWEEDDVRGAGIRAVPVAESRLRQQLVLIRRADEKQSAGAELFQEKLREHYRSILE